MSTFRLNINGTIREVNADPSTPLLWILRDHLDLVGTKYGCGIAQCGACTVHLNGTAVRACQLPVASLESEKITTIVGHHLRNTTFKNGLRLDLNFFFNTTSTYGSKASP